MPEGIKPVKALHRLLWPLIVLIIAADQISKAYFVWRLGEHQHTAFLDFAREYFTLWSTGNYRAVSETYGVLISSNHTIFKPLVWVWEPWIAWNLTTNTGAAWSIFAGNSFYLSFVSLAMALLLFYVWWRRFRGHTGMTWALGAIIGGALGNFVDRFRLREVVDFIDVKIPYIAKLIPALGGDPYDFPIFNVADSCAVCGTLALAAYLICADFAAMRRKRQTAKAAEVKPFAEGVQLDEAAVHNIRQMVASRPSFAGTDLTRFHE
ncbi:signal peptidase II [bacterium]|nr:signal peptidase II [bacterium]